MGQAGLYTADVYTMANEEPSSTEIAAAPEASAHRLGLQYMYLRKDQKEAIVSLHWGKTC